MTRLDINLGFKKHPITKDITLLRDKGAVDQSIKNIVLTSFNEVKRNPTFGTNVKSQLFNIASSVVAQVLKTDIKKAIETYEPEAEVITIQVTESDYDTIECRVIYTFRNDPAEQTTLVSLST
jgi:phage baseplate assembly protein W